MELINSEHNCKQSIKKGQYRIINCQNCGYWHVFPLPTEEELKVFYKTRYYETLDDNLTMSDKLNDPDGFYELQYEDRLRYVNNAIDCKLPKTVLDIGAGYGDFLRFMMKKGWKTQGIEPSRQACESIKDFERLNIYNADISRLADYNLEPSSVITLNNVLEHIAYPQKLLHVLKENFLIPGGIIYIVVPNDFNILQDILLRTRFKDNEDKQHYWVRPLDHINYWSPGSIKNFLQKCGFKIVYFTSDFPMEIFPLMGEDYVTDPAVGRAAHLKRVEFEKALHEANAEHFKDRLFECFAKLGIGRDMQILATAE